MIFWKIIASFANQNKLLGYWNKRSYSHAIKIVVQQNVVWNISELVFKGVLIYLSRCSYDSK